MIKAIFKMFSRPARNPALQHSAHNLQQRGQGQARPKPSSLPPSYLDSNSLFK